MGWAVIKNLFKLGKNHFPPLKTATRLEKDGLDEKNQHSRAYSRNKGEIGHTNKTILIRCQISPHDIYLADLDLIALAMII